MKALLIWFFLLALLAFPLVTSVFHKKSLEQRHSLDTREVLAEKGVSLSEDDDFFTYHDGRPAGTVPSGNLTAVLKSTRESVSEVWLDEDGLRAVESPVAATVMVTTADPASVTLTGRVASEATSAAFEKAAREARPNAKITNQIQVEANTTTPSWTTGGAAVLGDLLANTTESKAQFREVVVLEGITRSEEQRSALAGAAARISPDGSNVEALTLAAPKPEVLGLTIDGRAVQVSGTLRSAEARDDVVRTLEKAGFTVAGEVDVDPALAQAPWQAPALVGAFVPGTQKGWLKASGPSVEISGETTRKGADAAIASATGGARVKGNLKMAPPAESWLKVSETLKGDGLIAEGIVPTEADRQLILAELGKTGRTVENRLQSVEYSTPAPWLSGVAAYLPEYLQGVRKPGMEVVRNQVALLGVVDSEKVSGSIQNGVSKIVGRGFRIDNRLRYAAAPTPPVPAPDAVVSQLKEIEIYFDTNSVAVKASEQPKIKKMAEVVLTLPESTKLIVGGHADPRGNAEANRKLSIRRAGSVRDQLVKLGISTDRMVVQSFGESDAVEAGSETRSNDLSRRVELRIAR